MTTAICPVKSNMVIRILRVFWICCDDYLILERA